MSKIIAKKSLGQNFLKDEGILQRIANSIDVSKNDFILEIGAGMGALTKYLIKKECNYLGYEIDERMKPYLEKYQDETHQIVFDDFLRRDVSKDLFASYNHLFVIANIPYYITTPIVEHLIHSIKVESMILLVQKEVAMRFSAQPGSKDYGYFTVFLNHFFDVALLFDVSPSCFTPPPKVISSVVRLTRKENVVDVDVLKFQAFVKKLFSQKRKTLKNNLKEYDWNRVLSFLLDEGYSSLTRAEELPYDKIIKLYQELVLKN